MMEIQKVNKPTMPSKWSFENSETNIKNSIKQWRRLTEKILSECFLVYEYLKQPSGQRNDLLTNVNRLPTWQQWCESVGVSHMTFYRHFSNLGWIETKQLKPIINEDDERIITEILADFDNGDTSKKMRDFKHLVRGFDDGLSTINQIALQLNRKDIEGYQKQVIDAVKQSKAVRAEIENTIKSLKRLLKP